MLEGHIFYLEGHTIHTVSHSVSVSIEIDIQNIALGLSRKVLEAGSQDHPKICFTLQKVQSSDQPLEAKKGKSNGQLQQTLAHQGAG